MQNELLRRTLLVFKHQLVRVTVRLVNTVGVFIRHGLGVKEDEKFDTQTTRSRNLAWHGHQARLTIAQFL